MSRCDERTSEILLYLDNALTGGEDRYRRSSGDPPREKHSRA